MYINTCSIVLAVLPSIIHAIVCMRQGNFDSKTWLLIVRIDFPFEISNQLAKWCLLFLISVYAILVNMNVATMIFTYFICCTFYVEAICKDFRLQLRSVDKKVVHARKSIRFCKKLVARGECNKNIEREIVNDIEIELNRLIVFHCKIIE